MTLLLILFLGLCRGEILVDIAVVVPDSFNVSSFVNNMVQLSPPPTLNTTNNSTKNTTNYTATYAPFVLSGLSLNGIDSIICVAVMTGLPAARHVCAIVRSIKGICSTGT